MSSIDRNVESRSEIRVASAPKNSVSSDTDEETDAGTTEGLPTDTDAGGVVSRAFCCVTGDVLRGVKMCRMSKN